MVNIVLKNPIENGVNILAEVSFHIQKYMNHLYSTHIETVSEYSFN